MKTKDKLKLNHPCTFCKKEIYIGEGTIIEGELKHFKCYKNQIEQQMKKEFLEMIEELCNPQFFSPAQITLIKEILSRIIGVEK